MWKAERNGISEWALDIIFDHPQDTRKFRRLLFGNKAVLTELAQHFITCKEYMFDGYQILSSKLMMQE